MMRPAIIAVAIFGMLLTNLSCAPLSEITKPLEIKVVEPDDDLLKEYAEEISRLYGKLKILSIDEIPEEKYAEYKKYAQEGRAYLLVHPSYYVFFHNYGKNKVVVERQRGEFSKNIVDIFIDEYPAGKSRILRRMKDSERRERDFIKKVSAKGKLLILVLPPDYSNHPEYPYRKLDEFARYINEVTGGAPSVVYVESESHKRGYMTFESLPRLNRFLTAAEVKSLSLGGGYVDLCLKDFEEEARNLKDIEKIEVVREIFTESPDHMSEEQ
ncbi:MAG: hypothetical protein AAB275_05615 [Deltaproteobacteria bacterium]